MRLTTQAVRGLAGPGARLVETHISWVILDGPFAYKLKKPLDLGFLDFSTPEKRRHFCEEEVRLNRRFAPGLYLGVVPVTGERGSLAIEGSGRVVDWAVKMRRFDESALLGRRLAAGEVGVPDARDLGGWLARLHEAMPRRLPSAAGAPGSPESFEATLLQNFFQISQRLHDETRVGALAAMRAAALARHDRLVPLLRRRGELGFVRECHGDLHLDNIAWLEGRFVPFDCIEFSEHFRVMDVQAEAALLAMDLEARGRGDLAAACYDAYLGAGGDYAGIALTEHFRSHYALVRAKVARAAGHDGGFARYFALAERATRPSHPVLWLMHGLAGAGKTTVSEVVLTTLGAVRLRADVERKRLFGLPADAQTGSAPGGGLYDAAATDATYARLEEVARLVVGSGRHCIVDATFLAASRRSRFRGLARELGVDCRIVSCRASPETLRTRLEARQARAREASEADLAVLEYQRAREDPLRADETANAIVVRTDDPGWREDLASALRTFVRVDGDGHAALLGGEQTDA